MTTAEAINEIIYEVYHHTGLKVDDDGSLSFLPLAKLDVREEVTRMVIMGIHRCSQNNRTFKSYDW